MAWCGARATRMACGAPSACAAGSTLGMTRSGGARCSSRSLGPLLALAATRPLHLSICPRDALFMRVGSWPSPWRARFWPLIKNAFAGADRRPHSACCARGRRRLVVAPIGRSVCVCTRAAGVTAAISAQRRHFTPLVGVGTRGCSATSPRSSARARQACRAPWVSPSATRGPPGSCTRAPPRCARARAPRRLAAATVAGGGEDRRRSRRMRRPRDTRGRPSGGCNAGGVRL